MGFKFKLSGFLLSLVVLFAGPSHASVLLDRVVAVVNKDVITWSELYRAMEFEASSTVKAMAGAEKTRVFRENESYFLESMIDVKLQLQAAKKLDIEAGKDEVREAIDNVRKKYSMGDEEFSESLKKEGFTLNDYMKRIAEQIVLSKVVSQEVRNKIVVTDKEIEEYLAKNKDAGYRLRQIFFNKPKNNAEKKALEVRLEEVSQRLRNGDDFAALAAQYSDDPAGKAGGDLGFIKKEFLVKEFLEVIAEMKIGEVSKPFLTARGEHIIKLEDSSDISKIGSGTKDELKEIVKKKLFDRRLSEDLKNWIRSLRERAYVEVRL